MNRKLTQKEFNEIATLARRCIDAYSQKEVASEIKRLNFLANVLDIDPYISGVITEVASYAQEAAKQKPHNIKDHWVKTALGALGKLELSGVDREVKANG